MGQSKICHSLNEAKQEWIEIDWGRCRIKPYENFDKLTALYRTLNDKEGKGKHTNIVCKCSCGQHYVKIDAGSLTKGATTSCGCVQRKRTSEARLHDIAGQRFGKLVAIKRTNNINNRVTWLCQCDCGNTKIVTSSSLITKQVQSCGCLGVSKGENKIKELLLKYNITFVQQKTFESCKDKNLLPFDFYVNNEYIIEFDGEQHFFARKQGFFTENKVQIIKKHDNLKNNYCWNNNIPIIRIPYWQYENLTINDLKLETSNFIFTKIKSEEYYD